MNILKKVIATVLVGIMLLSFAGCHKKDELAVTIDGFEFTSAYYMCALINANIEAQSKVQETLTEEELSKEINYFSKKIDGKKYEAWVKDRAIDNLKEIAAYKSLCQKANLKLDDETKSDAEYYADFYWQSYGYSQLFEPNGVSAKTYTTYMTDASYSNLYFEHLYGKGGEKEIPQNEITDKLSGNFIIANLLEVNTSQSSDDEKATIKKTFEEYEKALKENTKTFEQIYKEYNQIEDLEQNSETSTEADKAEEKPLDEYATILGDKDTGYEHDQYKTIKEMKVGEIKLIEKDEEAGYILAVKKDILADPYYLNNLDLTVRHLIVDKEFAADFQKYAKDLKVEIVDYAVNQFKVKKIKEPTY